MNHRTLVLRSLSHFARNHLGVVLGAALASAVLTGALVVGDSVRHSLLKMALDRLGKVQVALVAGDRLVRDALGSKIGSQLGTPATSLLLLPGTATTAEGTARANQVQVLGVTPDFWKLSPGSSPDAPLNPEEALLNGRLASQLGVKAGDTVILRVAKPTQLSRDAPVSPQEDSTVALRVRVAGVLGESQFGRFSLHASQVPPFNAMVSMAWLQSRLEIPGKANLVLAATGGTSTPDHANRFLEDSWTLEDASLLLRPADSNRPVELRTSRVFLDPPVEAASSRLPRASYGVLTYFVNALRHGERATPYSMVTATDAPWLPRDLQDDEIMVTQWLAEDLGLKPGSKVTAQYFTVGTMRKLEEQSNVFSVRGILPEKGPHDDPSWMPDFPGLATANNCRDWDAGFPIDFEKIRDKDNAYWELRRGTPKAFMTLKAGQKLWSNRFGNLTAVRFEGAPIDTNELSAALLKSLTPASIGLRFEDVRVSALAAATGGQDFGQLFLGFSFFLVLSALILTTLLFQFGLDQRTSEVGLLLALGWPAGRVRNLLLGEGALLALVGSLAGLAGGVAYAQAMLWGLSTLWKEAVGTSSLSFHATAFTLGIGLFAAWGTATGALWFSIRGAARRPARELLSPLDVETLSSADQSGGLSVRQRPARLSMNQRTSPPQPSPPLRMEGRVAEGRERRRLGSWPQFTSFVWRSGLPLVTAVAGVVVAGAGLFYPSLAPGFFFGAGALLLISGLGFMRQGLLKLDTGGQRLPSSSILALRNLARRPKRSLAVAGLLACGSFMIVAVSANRLDAGRDAFARGSGTGGFALIAESSDPIVHDLNSKEGQEFHNLNAKELEGVRFVPFRVKDGEDASCLNLNRAQQPRIVGVDPSRLAELGAFSFSRLLDPKHRAKPWLSLDASRGEPDLVPGIGDAASIQWALGKSLGDTLDLVDQQGRPFRILLVGAVAGSILQGQIVIAEKDFLSRFSSTGYRMFLADAPSDRVAAVRAHLTRSMQDHGVETSSTVERLAAFNAVQNTYLNTFQALGGLGLLLGSFGVGIVVLRTILERGSELALLSALGWTGSSIRQLMLREHLSLFLCGLLIGTLASSVAVFPSLAHPGSGFPLGTLAATLGAILANGALWVWCAAWGGIRGELLAPLKRQA